MFFEIFTETCQSFDYEICPFNAYRAVSGIHDTARGLFDAVNDIIRTGSVKHFFDKSGQLSEPDPAGHTFTTGLSVGKPQEIQEHVHRAQTGRTCRYPSFNIPVQAFDRSLRPVRIDNT
jgi:hypothetical protein